ncbi:MAG: tRNA (guanosine(37)-N1)-methyltransferase TrmD [Burkholderiales bacterium]|nr:tRNA (guanosine(37)-N1)-methyltransferase TrmD [Burkholderiales bacterium]
MLQFDVITLFPPMFDAITGCGVTGRARDRGLYQLVAWNPRDFAANSYRAVDDRPYGGGPGMVMMAEPLDRAIAAACQRQKSSGVKNPRVICLSPQGRLLDHGTVMELAQAQGIVMLAGRYEGVDERVMRRRVDDEISIGDYVLSGGELAAMVVMDCVVRQLPGALGATESAARDSFADGLLDCPHYTRPEVYEGDAVPPVLLSGNHAEIERWRRKQALGRTWQRRPDLLEKRALSAEERALLDEFRKEAGT